MTKSWLPSGDALLPSLGTASLAGNFCVWLLPPWGSVFCPTLSAGAESFTGGALIAGLLLLKRAISMLPHPGFESRTACTTNFVGAIDNPATVSKVSERYPCGKLGQCRELPFLLGHN